MRDAARGGLDGTPSVERPVQPGLQDVRIVGPAGLAPLEQLVRLVVAAAAGRQVGAAKPDPVILRRLASHPVQGLAHRQNRRGLRVELPVQTQESGLVGRHGPALLDSPADRARRPVNRSTWSATATPAADLSAVHQQRGDARLGDGKPAVVQRQPARSRSARGASADRAAHAPRRSVPRRCAPAPPRRHPAGTRSRRGPATGLRAAPAARAPARTGPRPARDRRGPAPLGTTTPRRP